MECRRVALGLTGQKPDLRFLAELKASYLEVGGQCPAYIGVSLAEFYPGLHFSLVYISLYFVTILDQMDGAIAEKSISRCDRPVRFVAQQVAQQI